MKERVYNTLKSDLMVRVIDWGSKLKVVSTLPDIEAKKVIKLSLPPSKIDAACAEIRKNARIRPSNIENANGKRDQRTPYKAPESAPKRSTAEFNFHTPAKLKEVLNLGKAVKEASAIMSKYATTPAAAQGAELPQKPAPDQAENSNKAAAPTPDPDPSVIMVDNEMYEGEETLNAGGQDKVVEPVD